MQQIQQVLSKLSHGVDYIWAQEEPRNMGAWSFVAPRFENILGVKVWLVRDIFRNIHCFLVYCILSPREFNNEIIENFKTATAPASPKIVAQ